MMSQSKPSQGISVLDRVILLSLRQIVEECSKKQIVETSEPIGKLYVFREMRSVLRSDHALQLRQESPLDRVARELPDYSNPSQWQK